MSSATASATTDFSSFMELSSWEIEFSWTSTHRDSRCCAAPTPQQLRLDPSTNSSTRQGWSRICGRAKFSRRIHVLIVFPAAAIRLSVCLVYQRNQFTALRRSGRRALRTRGAFSRIQGLTTVGKNIFFGCSDVAIGALVCSDTMICAVAKYCAPAKPRAREEIECSAQYPGVSRDPIHC